MADPYRRQTIEAWVGDFGDAAVYRDLPPAAKEYAPQILPAFLTRACTKRGMEPDQLEEGDCKSGLLEGVGGLALPASVRAVAPDLCAAFLGALELQGRLAGGRALGRYVRALRQAFLERTSEKPSPVRNPGTRIGRNAPCPCGSGRKYKHCCMRR